MKILIFAEVYFPDVIGGGEFSTKMMTEGLAARGHEIDVYCLGKNNVDEKINGINIHRRYVQDISEHFFSKTKNNSIQDTLTTVKKIIKRRADIYYEKRWYKHYCKIINDVKPDVVHSVAALSYLGRFNLWKAAFDNGIPVSHVSRSPNLIELQFLGGKLNRYYIHRNAFASKYLDGMAAPSKYMLECHTKVGIKGRRFNDVIYNAVEFDAIEPTEEFVNNKKNIIIYAGDIRQEKGIATLIEAVQGIPNIELLLIGKGAMTSSIKQDEKIRIISWLDKKTLYKYMQKAKIVVLPSEWEEAFGRILIEGIANGTLALGSNRGGIPEVLNYDNNFIFESGNVSALQDRLNWVLSLSTEDYLTIWNRQKSWMNRYSKKNYCDEWERFFSQQIGGSNE